MFWRHCVRSIRFTEFEWDAVTEAAEKAKLSPPLYLYGGGLTPELTELIKRTFRGIHLLAVSEAGRTCRPWRGRQVQRCRRGCENCPVRHPRHRESRTRIVSSSVPATSVAGIAEPAAANPGLNDATDRCPERGAPRWFRTIFGFSANALRLVSARCDSPHMGLDLPCSGGAA